MTQTIAYALITTAGAVTKRCTKIVSPREKRPLYGFSTARILHAEVNRWG